MSRTLLAALTAFLVLSLMQHLLTSVASARLRQDVPPPSFGWTTPDAGAPSPHVYQEPGR